MDIIGARTTLLDAGTRMSVLWRDNDCFYPGNEARVVPDVNRHVLYDAGDVESLNLRNEGGCYCSASLCAPQSVSSNLPRCQTTCSKLSALWTKISDHVCNESVMLHQAQGFHLSPIHNSPEAEKQH